MLPVLAHVDHETVSAVLVEQDTILAREARATASRLGGHSVMVLAEDAGETGHFMFALPVDLLLLCGIFGNVSEEDIAITVDACPAMLRPGGMVIWTRGSSEPDLRPAIRRWFADAGLLETAFDSEPEGFAVGVAIKSRHATTALPIPPRLFAFLR